MLGKYLLGAVALFAGISTATDCDSGPWNAGNINWVGGDGGGAFCETKWKAGVVITGVDVYATGDGVEALQFYYSDGTSGNQWGQVNGHEAAKSLHWDPTKGESIQQLRMWGNGVGTRLGRVYLRTSTGATLDAGKDTSGQKVYEKPVDSGVMLAAFGKCGDSIDNLGLIFMKSTVASVQVTNTKFADTPDELNKKQEGLQMCSVDTAIYTNANSQNGTYLFQGQDSRTTSKTYTVDNTNTFGFSEAIEIGTEGGLPGLIDINFKSTTTLSYGYSNSKSESSSTTSTHSLTYNLGGPIVTGEVTYCQAVVMLGTYDGKFTCTVVMQLADGSNFSFASQGTMKQVAYSNVQATCQKTPFAAQYPSLPPKKRALKFLA